MHTWGVTYRNIFFTGITTHVIILSLIGIIQCGKEALRDNMVSKMIEELDRRGKLVDLNQKNGYFTGGLYEMENEIDGKRGGRIGEVE